MFKKRVISCLVVLSLLWSVTAGAMTFSDVEDDYTVEWAREYINEMAGKGYIKGTGSDGKGGNLFAPKQDVTKMQSMLLFSRVLGVEEESDSAVVALEIYSTQLASFSTQYKSEVAFFIFQKKWKFLKPFENYFVYF